MNKKITLGILIVIIIGGIYFAFNTANNENDAATAQPIKIGFMLPLTGQFGAIGEGIKNAGMMAVEDYNTTHPNTKVEVVLEDDGFDTKKGLSAYTKLTTLDKVDSIMMVSTPVLDALHTTMNTDGLPLVSIGLQNDGVQPDNIFQTTLSPIAPIEYIARNVENKNHAHVAVIYNNSLSATQNFYNAFVKTYTKNHTDFVVTDEQSAKMVATKIISGDIDAVVILEDAIGGPLVTKHLKMLDKNNKLTYYYDLQLQTGWAEYKKIVGDTNNLNNANTLKIKGGDTKNFGEKYKAKYGSDPAPFSEYGYDSVMVLLNSYDNNRTTWVSNIQNTSLTGPSGKITFDQNGVRIQEIEMVSIQNGTIPE